MIPKILSFTLQKQMKFIKKLNLFLKSFIGILINYLKNKSIIRYLIISNILFINKNILLKFQYQNF